tara:strand:+ start:3329 stop:3589 length:261 start_codon:yes stop_codon:yes gene_type:complete
VAIKRDTTPHKRNQNLLRYEILSPQHTEVEPTNPNIPIAPSTIKAIAIGNALSNKLNAPEKTPKHANATNINDGTHPNMIEIPIMS